MRAFVFPGQGAQIIGMGRDLAASYPAAKAVFEEVDDALDQNLSELMWEGDIDTLTLTANAQPALMATSIAVLRALETEGITLKSGSFVAGHSLGEYSALAASQALSLSDTARLLRIRGNAMQNAVTFGEGAMAAILGLDFNAVKTIAEVAAEGEVCQAANDNDPAQVVVSGHTRAVERAIDLAKNAGAKRALKLPVSAPFHCKLMKPAAERMSEALEVVDISKPTLPIIANVKAAAVTDPSDIRSLLVKQVTGVVRWRESIIYLVSEGVSEVWELGAGKTLCGMVRRIDKSINCQAIGSPDDIVKLISN
ncbi:MAG: ACP S-malonyltransferase [Planktomarina sp.]|nr:ACP S-malonyltransferase [Planktomarina sp.]